MLKRTLEQEANQFLIDYSTGVREVCGISDSKDDGKDRFEAWNKLREQGIKRIKGLVAEFGK